MALRRRKSRKSKVIDLLGTYLKLQAAKDATKGARKAAKGTAVYQVAKRTPAARKVPVIVGGVGIAAAAAVAATKLRGGDHDTEPALSQG